MNELQNKSVSLIGFGISNKATLSYLLSKGIYPTIRTENNEKVKDGIRTICGGDYLLAKEDIIFRSPVIRPDRITTSGIITTEIDFSLKRARGIKIGITGSDGKTTTSTIIYSILTSDKKKALLCGNVGSPLIASLDKTDDNSYIVAELSSFQLIDMEPVLNVAVITNITENHLDWHKDLEEYISAKLNITKRSDKIVLDYDNDILRKSISSVPRSSRLALVSLDKKIKIERENTDYVYIDNGSIYYNDKKILSLDKIALRGKHNIKNYELAIASVYGYVSRDSIEETATCFKGVKNRCELILEKNGVKFYSSSIDTTPSRTIATLDSFDISKAIIILGGYDKNLDYNPLSKSLDGAYACVLCGENKDKIYNAIRSTKTKIFIENSFFSAVKRAYSLAREGDSVLLSPASASFDMFKSYKERARAFEKIIKEL